MLLKNIATYYHYLWFVLLAVTILKVILSYLFNSNLQGFQGLLIAIFKWYGDNDQEMAETTSMRTGMRLLNVFTFLIYFILLFIIVTSIIPMFIPA